MPTARSEPRYTAADLAARAGTSERTVRFYVAEGLLPKPKGRGRGAHFGPEHLNRLRLIRTIQQAGNDLAMISEYLNELGDDPAKTAAALQVWEARQEQAEWARTWRERFGVASNVLRYRIAEGVELLIDANAARGRKHIADVLRLLRKAFAPDEND